LAPAVRGDILIFHAACNRSWRSSMEIGVRVIAENPKNGEQKHILSAYLTFVALDKNHKPIEVPQIIPESEKEKRRYAEAEFRRQNRQREAQELKAQRGLV